MSKLSNPGKNGGRLKRYPKGVSGNPKGRPPKLVTTLVKDLKKAGYEAVGPSSITHLMEAVLGLPESKLRELSKDDDQPLSVRLVARAMLSPKGFTVMQTVLDRAHGKPRQLVDFKGDPFTEPPVINVTVQPYSSSQDGVAAG